MQPTIAACLIVKGSEDEAELLDNCLTSIAGHVDAIYLNINAPKIAAIAPEVIAVAKKHKTHFITSIWKGNFVDARTKNFSQAKEDFIIWLDTDDTIDKPEEIRKTVAIVSKQQQGVFVKYDYDHDELGNVTISHWVARIVRNNGSYKWQSSVHDKGVAVHETLVEVISKPKASTEDFVITHHSNFLRRYASLQRNIALLEGMYAAQVKRRDVDPRTLFYLATHYFDAEEYAQAQGLFSTYLQLSGWAEERCEALVYLGRIYELQGKDAQAHHSYLLAIGEYQNSPRPYLELSKMEFKKTRYDESANWIEKLLQLPPPKTTMVQRPMENSFSAYLIAAQAYVNMGGKNLDKASTYVKKALQLRPLDKDAQNARDMIEELIDKREDIRAAMRIVRRYEKSDKERIVPFLDSLPAEVQDNPLILTKRHEYSEPKTWGKKTIALYVGQGPLGVWGPWSLDSGIGGSEEAVIHLSRKLRDLGWSVTIFATPGEKAGFDGDIGINAEYPNGMPYIQWKQYYEFNPKDEYNILIAWRNPMFFDAPIKAKKKYLWLHDVMDKEEFTKERLDNLDKVIFVGQYHADFYKGVIPEKKWLISGNGIDPQDFIEADGKFKRQPHRMIYMSAYNRGLKILLDNWQKIRKAVPDATLDIYYGWESYDAILKDNPERMLWKEDLVKQMKSLNGVTDRGRVGQKQIIEEINKAEILAYPCIFPEVYCITYVKALAGGLMPITSNYAELEHYAKYGGIQSHYEHGKIDELTQDYIPKLITALQEKKPTIDTKTVRRTFSWEATANQWDDDFNK